MTPLRTPSLLLLLVATGCAVSYATTSTTTPATPSAADPAACFAGIDEVLSADTMDGRGVGSAGLEKAATWLAGSMDQLGLKKPGKDHAQPFDVTTGVKLGDKNALSAGAALTAGTDFTPLGFSKSAPFSGGLVFAGYGITATDLKYDDYAGLDVKGKVVLALRFEPGEGDEKSPFDGKRPTRYSDLRTKAIRAREAGAVALVVVSPAQAADEPDKLPPLRTMGPLSDAGIPVVQVTRAVADRWLAAAGTTVAASQAKIDGAYAPASLPVPNTTVTGTTDLVQTKATVKNVVGVLPGAGTLASEIVVLGAHYDHLGHGGTGSFRPDVDAIHNGADDNASGVAAVLCAAGQLAKDTSAKDRRTLVVVNFAAEEIGLGGSAWYVKHPAVGDLAHTVAMVNLDMVGRLRDEKLTIFGTDTAPEWKDLLEKAKSGTQLSLTENGDGYGPSDQSSFYAEGVPVVHLFTGAHAEYHTPDDKFALLNTAGGGEVVTFTKNLVGALLTASRPQYVRTTTSAPTLGDSRGYGAYFGSVPDYTAMEATTGGVKLSDVRAGSPAEKAGLRKGDTIIKMAGMKVENLYDMTYVLREHKPGETIDVVVLRDGQEVASHTTLQVRPTDSGSSHAGPPTYAPHTSLNVGADPAADPKSWAPTAGKAVPELQRADEPHLTDLRRLTFGGENAEAYWTPDGRHLTLQATPPNTECDAEYVADLTTGDLQLLSSGKGRTTCGYADYPKGGSYIYATTEAAGESCPAKPDMSQGYVWALYNAYDIVRDDGQGHRSTLLASPGYDAEATECVKDGRILFTSTRDGDIDLYVSDKDGKNVKRLTDTPGYDGGAYFTKDCKNIVWRASRPTGDALVDYQNLLAKGLVRPTSLEIFTAKADGSHARQLTHLGVGSFAPFPTPDGKGVLFASNPGKDPREFDICYVAYDGKSDPVQITHASGFDGFPMFSPDGKWLAFSSNRADPPGGHDTDVYVARWVP